MEETGETDSKLLQEGKSEETSPYGLVSDSNSPVKTDFLPSQLKFDPKTELTSTIVARKLEMLRT